MTTYQCANLSSVIRTAWFFLGRTHPSLSRVFFTIVLPLSLLPPVMLYYAGTYQGDIFMPGLAARNWLGIGLIFLVAELATVLAMAHVIRWIAAINGFAADRSHAALLAVAAPIPLWLSSLGLFVPNIFFNVALCCLALGLACIVIYHGVAVLLKVRDDTQAASIAYGIMGVGLIAWALLLIIVIPGG
ncbi:YIP1 family protein [Denitratisoma oestradiolicum]|uniref:Yip1 domain-containing protein n=1 Tax=Denitratisoma oestradiolicum TaxID=311182 RepID=A0A6S6XZL7_9PROT|nr:YIP1 family protein [Denitratisoma oestradiolicum]TWO79880.1 hypothetical protein CBW56_12290 [Denitratisoma oestradiolicum]CAB1369631.1 conserved membrane protein of unknown function [Denitratisoma oestradiolicum]